MMRLFAYMGQTIERAVAGAGEALTLLLDSAFCVRHAWKRRKFLVDQLYTCAIRPLPVVLIDALEVMSISPASFLVMPRLVAMALLTPLLTLVTDVVGILGGCLVSATRLQISPEVYMKHVADSLSATLTIFELPKDVYTGLAKAFVFGVIIATVG